MRDYERYDDEGEHKTLKLAVRIGLVSLALALTALLVLPNLIDWNRYKPAVEAMLVRSTGYPIRINGDLDATLLWTPALMASSVSVENAPGGVASELVKLERLDARMDLFPLLAGKVRIRTIKLVGPTLAIERRNDGSLNLRPATPPPEQPAKGVGLGWFHVGPEDISIDSVIVERGQIVYRDLAKGWSEELSGLDATMGAPSLKGPYTLRGDFDWRKRRYGLTFDQSLPQNGKRQLNVKLTQADTGTTASLAGRVDTSAAGTRSVSGALSVRAASPRALLMPDSKGGRESAFAVESVLVADAKRATLSELVMQWGAFTATGQASVGFDTAPAQVVLKGRQFDVDELWTAPDAKGAPPFWPTLLIGAAHTRSEDQTAEKGVLDTLAVKLDLSLDSITLRKGLVENARLQASLSQGQLAIDKLTGRLPGETDVEIHGRVAHGAFDGDAALAGSRAREFCAWIGLPVDGVPQSRLKTFAYRGGLAFGVGKASFRGFEAALDGGLASGSLTVAPGTRTHIDGELKVTRLNLDPYAPLWRSRSEEQTSAPQVTDRFALAPVFEAADTIDGTLKLDVASFTWRQVKMDGVVADLAHEGETLTIRELTIGNVDGARLTLAGEGKALAGKASITANGKLEGNDVAPALVLVGVLPDTSRAVLGPGTLTITASLAAGSGQVHAEGRLDAATVAFDAELVDVERPLLGTLGSGRYKSTLSLASTNAANLAAPFGFAAPRTSPNSPRAGTLTLVSERGGETATSTLDVKAGDAVASGKLVRNGREAATFDGMLTVTVPDLPRLLTSIGADVPKSLRPGEGLSLALAGKGPKAGVVLQPFSLTLGKDRLTGEGGLDLSGTMPRIDLGVKATSLDLDRVGALWRAWNGRTVLQGWSDSPLPLRGLAKFEGSLNAEAETIRLFGLAFETPHFSARLTQGTLHFTDGRATLFGGPMTANWTLRGGDNAPGFAASVKFIDVDGKALTEALWGEPVIEAPLDGALSLSAAGISEHALAASLNGDVTLRSRDGRVHGFDLAAFEAARAALGPGDNADRAIAKLSSGTSTFKSLDAKASVEGGVLRMTEGAFQFPTGDGVLAGGIDAANQTIAVSLDLPVHESQATAVLTVNGPLPAPKRLLDSKTLKSELIKEASRRPPPAPAQPTPQVETTPLPAPPTRVHPSEGAAFRGADGIAPSGQ